MVKSAMCTTADGGLERVFDANVHGMVKFTSAEKLFMYIPNQLSQEGALL